MGLPMPRARGPGVRRDHLMRMEQRDAGVGGPDPERLPDQAMGRTVVGGVKHRTGPVAMDLLAIMGRGR